eukprot:UN00929
MNQYLFYTFDLVLVQDIKLSISRVSNIQMRLGHAYLMFSTGDYTDYFS